MTAESREELLSAYLDDELSPNERAQVEQWLLDSAEYRQLFEELRGARHDMQSLPRHKLSEDLGPAVLRRAERAVLSGHESPPGSGSITPGSAVARWWSRTGSKRKFIWPVVAVAAALLVALFDVDHDEREIAQQAPRQEGANEAADEVPRDALGEGHGDIGLFADEDVPAGGTAGATPALSIAPQSKLGREAATSFSAAPERSSSVRSGNGGRDVDPLHRARKMAEGEPESLSLKASIDVPTQRPERKFIDALKMETNVRRALENREQVNFIQCDVSPDFINDNQMEKLLTGNSAKFVRLAEPTSGEQSKRAVAGDKIDGKSQWRLELRYAVEATPAQVEKIVMDLEKERRLKRVSNMILGLQEQAPADKAQVAKTESGQKADAYFLGKQQAIMIYLRQMDVPEPAAPAEP